MPLDAFLSAISLYIYQMQVIFKFYPSYVTKHTNKVGDVYV